MLFQTPIFMPRSRRAALFGGLLCGFVCHSPLADTAEPSWYAELVGGVGALSSTQLTGAAEGKASFDPGFSAGLAVGRKIGAWRIEGEYLYQTNDGDDISVTGLAVESGAGDFSAVAISASALREFNLLPGDRARSYAGLGITWLQEVDIDFITPAGEQSFSSDDVALQVLAGVDYRLTNRWSLGMEARYLAAGKLTLKPENDSAVNLKAEYDRTSVLLSLRYRF